MQFSYATLLALAATVVTANPLTRRSQPGWEFPESMPLAARQTTPEPGTPLYLCHENCGTSITLSREEGYCTNWQYIARLDACLLCANEHNIWQYYGNSVTAAATTCGFTATPARL
ncbi:predicted protein [Verticillium alfalfae VaMs.102]|uniref:Predicted protein n=2 Tax=Verticillium TaxID=1036719 RepID=C9SET5_VERA1|nr:predicted protein [Verticillium alfalfae VaMs.102]EEY16678.1 predicted protein [Verticillium alfalfae VaMs.102]